MDIQDLSTAPGPSFNQPLDMLLGCHARILKFCDQLERLAEHLDKQGVNQEARESAEAIARYFNTAGKLHHEDEEQNLFPVLLELDPTLASHIDKLLADHRELDNTWNFLATVLAELDDVDFNLFHSLARGFIERNRNHVELENRELIPAAQRLMDAQQLETLGRAMAQRRNVEYPSSGSDGVA